ncbi:histidine phosphatase family protein [Deinococcus aquaticus]|uniref:histidine phosphatase family protein n=1 Tax=Deinococcus aquaticus TaxID=328692 RepID=UPI00361274D7
MGRARQTARLAGFPDALPQPALAEASFGVMAGHTWTELEAAHGEAPRTWIDALSDPHSPHGPPAVTPATASTRGCRRGWTPCPPARPWPSRTPGRCWPRCASPWASRPQRHPRHRRHPAPRRGHWWLTALRPPT